MCRAPCRATTRFRGTGRPNISRWSPWPPPMSPPRGQLGACASRVRDHRALARIARAHIARGRLRDLNPERRRSRGVPSGRRARHAALRELVIGCNHHPRSLVDPPQIRKHPPRSRTERPPPPPECVRRSWARQHDGRKPVGCDPEHHYLGGLTEATSAAPHARAHPPSPS